MKRGSHVKRAGVFATAVALALLARPAGPDNDALAAAAAQASIQPVVVTAVYYSFQVEIEGLPKRLWKPLPRNIDVTYRDLDSGRLRTERGVDAGWGVIFRNPRVRPAQMEAAARTGGYLWCRVEVWRSDSSGSAVSDYGRHRCRVKRRF